MCFYQMSIHHSSETGGINNKFMFLSLSDNYKWNNKHLQTKANAWGFPVSGLSSWQSLGQLR